MWRRLVSMACLGGSIYSAAKRRPWAAVGLFGAWAFFDGRLPWITSRDPDQEGWQALKHLLHAEGHLLEQIPAESGAARSRMIVVLDAIRGRRQALALDALRRSSGLSEATPQMVRSWCSLKHLLTAEGHLEEMLENAARDGRDCSAIAEQLRGTRMAREEILGVAGCRCNRDLTHGRTV